MSNPADAALLVLVFDGAAIGKDVETRVASLVDAGVDWLQVRDRTLEADALFDLTRRVVAGARAARRPTRVIVNRRIDVAIAAGADGAHLGFDALEIEAARPLFASPGLDAPRARTDAGPIFGVSCHSVDEVLVAAERGADYVHLAPIFDPISKPAERPALGLRAIRAARHAPTSVIAQGGLTDANAGETRRAGAAGIAVTGFVLGATAPLEAVGALRRGLDAAAAAETKAEAKAEAKAER